jgi:putative transposase
VTLAEELGKKVGLANACAALGVSRSTLYRHRKPSRPATPRPTPARALSSDERQAVLTALHSERFMDRAPAEVAATLSDDEGTYLCSVRTMYRILDANEDVRERRDQLRHPNYTKPELLATAPNQVWTWDITKLKGPVTWTYFYLYVIIDIFSRDVVGWMVADGESSALAQRLMRESCEKQGIEQGQLTIHSDRGASMTSIGVAQLLGTLGVTKSFSRPHVSNDNPYSESHFKTLKYRPDFPDRFGCIEDAISHCRRFFDWYRNEHRHSGIAMLTPATVHQGRAGIVLLARARVLQRAYEAHPERFVNGPPKAAELPTAAWINPPTPKVPQ